MAPVGDFGCAGHHDGVIFQFIPDCLDNLHLERGQGAQVFLSLPPNLSQFPVAPLAGRGSAAKFGQHGVYAEFGVRHHANLGCNVAAQLFRVGVNLDDGLVGS